MGYERSAYLMYLAAVPIFRGCTDHQLERLADLSEAVTFDAGTRIITEGDDPGCFYLIMSGECVVLRSGDIVATLGAGDYFGELSLLDPGPRNSTVECASECLAAAVRRDAFRVALEEVPELRDALLAGMARRLHDLDSHV